jgi:cytidylate kinase
MGEKASRNARVQKRYDALMAEGKHGHYETLFRVVKEEVEAERQRWISRLRAADDAAIDAMICETPEST